MESYISILCFLIYLPLPNFSLLAVGVDGTNGKSKRGASHQSGNSVICQSKGQLSEISFRTQWRTAMKSNIFCRDTLGLFTLIIRLIQR